MLTLIYAGFILVYLFLVFGNEIYSLWDVLTSLMKLFVK